MLFPRQMLAMMGFELPRDRGRSYPETATVRQLMIYRISGLWKAAAGVVSLAVWKNGDDELQRAACGFFAVVHFMEVVIKFFCDTGTSQDITMNVYRLAIGTSLFCTMNILLAIGAFL